MLATLLANTICSISEEDFRGEVLRGGSRGPHSIPVPPNAGARFAVARRSPQGGQVRVDASPVEHAASVVQPDAQTVLNLMVVVGLMHGVIRRRSFDAGSTTLPNFLERVFW